MLEPDESGLLLSGDMAPVSGVYKGFHQCGRGWFHMPSLAGAEFQYCVDCGLIRFALFALSPAEERAYAA